MACLGKVSKISMLTGINADAEYPDNLKCADPRVLESDSEEN